RINMMTAKIWSQLRTRRYRERHPERVNEQNRKYRWANPWKVRVWQQRGVENCRELHLEEYRKLHRDWANSHPEHRRAQRHRRRARILGNGGSWTEAEWQT